MAFWKRSTTKPDAIPQPSTRPVAVTSMPVAERKPVDKPPLELLNDEDLEVATAKKGFDPYNSGAFDFRHTWAKVNRKK